MASKSHRLLSRYLARRLGSQRHYQTPIEPRKQHRRMFHSTRALAVVKPYLLADIGEGITECQIIQWYVQPGARVEQFDKICEVQSDKASVEITSRFDGIVKKLYYEADDMARVGKPLIDIDILSEISSEDAALTQVEENGDVTETSAASGVTESISEPSSSPSSGEASVPQKAEEEEGEAQPSRREPRSNGKHAGLATPAVRHLIREMSLEIDAIPGTGKDGRVLKEDVHRYAAAQKEPQTLDFPMTVDETTPEDKTMPLTPLQNQMFKAMTRSLAIPHFLYTDNVDFTSLTTVRRKLNAALTNPDPQQPKVSALAFVIKAVSLALRSHPTLNAHLDTTTEPSKPQLHLKASHDIGVAVDSPTGLLVPVIRGVQNRSILSIASEIVRLSALARAGRLTAAELSGVTFTVSNIGSIGGTAVAPVIVPPQVAILGIGKSRAVPAFDAQGQLVRKEECVFSWSADHRVLDGAVVARCAELVRLYLEDVEGMAVRLR